MSSPAVHVLPARSWAADVAAEFGRRLIQQPRLRICLPTGDTPAPLYAALAEMAIRGELSFALATIILLDEYVDLPVGDPARGASQVRHDLLDRLPSGPARFHAIRVDELAPERAAAELDATTADGLDLALVGLGLNGHVGFNEPGSTAQSPTRVVPLSRASVQVATAEYGAKRAPSTGITLGLARILEAAEIWLLVTGERKADVLRRALEEPETPDCPASFLRRHARLHVFADDAAADLLTSA